MENDQSSDPSTDGSVPLPAAVSEVDEGYSLASPDGTRTVTVILDQSGDDPATARYSISADGQTVVEASRLGLSFATDEYQSAEGFEITSVSSRTVDDEWEPVWSEQETIPDAFNELTLELRDLSVSALPLELIFRAYDEGVAFRYRIPDGEPSSVDIGAELTEFRVDGDATLYGSWHESEYQRIDPADVRVLGPHGDRVDRLEVPVTVETPDGPWLSIQEANVDDYPRTTLVGRDGDGAGLVTDVTEPIHVREDRDDRPAAVKDADTDHVRVDRPFATPWRVVLVGSSQADLVESDYLVQNLNEPNRVADTSWITPGKGLVARTTTTDGAKRYVDRADELGFEWLIWDGPEAYYDDDQWGEEADATTARDGFDVPEIVDYADRHGVKLMFYLQHFYIHRNREAILDRFAEWGVHGIKIGFVNTGPQEWTNWHRETIRMAAEREIHVDIHDQHRPDGFSRTYPNLIAVEGGRGNEWSDSYPPNGETPWGRSMAAHNADLPVTRYLLGPFDYTYNYMPDGDLELTTTNAHKLAQSVVNFHPYTDFFRRDRDGRLVTMSDPQEKLIGLQFWRHLPTTWDETHVLTAQIGDIVSVARRHGDEWFVGTITGGESRLVEHSLDFLDGGRRYDATVYEHDEGTETIDGVGKRTLTLSRGDTLTADLAAESGQAVRLVPEE